MATYTETFVGQTTGANSTTFTNRYATESNISVENPAVLEEDARVLRFNTGDSGIQLQSFDSVDGDANRDNCEMVARFYQTGDHDNQARVTGRASGSSGSETCYMAFVNSSGQFVIGRYSSSSYTQIGTGVNVDAPESPWAKQHADSFTDVPPNKWLWIRFRINGTGATVTLQARFWADGQLEPTTWHVDTTDTSGSRITAAGWCGLGRGIHSSAVYLDYFSVGTNGDSPAIVADTANPVRITTANLETAVADGATPVRITTVNAEAAVADGATPVRITAVNLEVLTLIPQPKPKTVVAIIGTSLG